MKRPLSCYVASKFENKEVVRAAQAKMRELGFTISYDWTPSSIEGMTEAEASVHQSKQAAKDMIGVLSADVMLFICHEGVKGTLVELGMAIGSGKEVVVVGDLKTCMNVFWFLSPVDAPNVHFFKTLDDAYAAMQDVTQNLLRSRQASKNVANEVVAERARQEAKWGEQNNPDGTGGADMELMAQIAKRETDEAHKDGSLTYKHILKEEFFEALAESNADKLRAELVQVAAVAVAWIEAIDRRPKAGDATQAV